MNFLLIIGLIVVNFPIFKIISKMIFPNPGGLAEAIRYSFTPDVVSLFKGEYIKDRGNEMALGLLTFLCGMVVFLEFMLLTFVFNLIF